MKIQKVSSIHECSTEYLHTDGTTRDAIVMLTINHLQKTYDITPSDKMVDNSFTFVNASHQLKKWEAVAESIKGAIHFANSLLEPSIPELKNK